LLIHLDFLTFRTYVLNDSAYIGYDTLLYCCVLLINDDNIPQTFKVAGLKVKITNYHVHSTCGADQNIAKIYCRLTKLLTRM